jgi:hypothetical protein
MVTEHKLGLYEARNTLGTLVMAAAYGPARFVIQRYGKTVAAVVGIAELEALRDLQDAQGEPEPQLPPPQRADPLDELRQRYEQGEILPSPRTEEERELHFRLAKEIGERLLKGGAEA